MSTIWWFTPCLSDDPGLDRLSRHCKFASDESQLALTLEKFSLDCFYWIDCHSLQPYMFVSQDLRDAMALGPQDVRYLPVDASLSAPLPRSKNYMIMHVPAVENISDPDQSAYHGTAGDSEEPILVGGIAIGRDADPKHDIFRDSFFSGFVFCIDELAVRVLQRRCSGIRFVDPWYLDDALRFRSLRGIEEKNQDVAQGASHTVAGTDLVTEATLVTDNDPLTVADRICAEYGDHIPGVQFAAVRIPLGSPGTNKANPAKLARSADESLRSDGGEIITATQLLSALDQSGERDVVSSTMAKFQLHPKWAAHILAARAYVWANKFAPTNFADVPAGGPGLESVAKTIMLLELTRPGTLYNALRGDRLSIIYIRMAAEEGLRDPDVEI